MPWVLFPHMHYLTVEMMKTLQYLRKEVGVRTKKRRGSADKTRKKMRRCWSTKTCKTTNSQMTGGMMPYTLRTATTVSIYTFSFNPQT